MFSKSVVSVTPIFKAILDGQCDHLPEQAFYMVGTLAEAEEKAKTMEQESA